MLIRYCGPKPLPRRIPTPIPFVSHSEGTGQYLEFSPECEVPNEDWSRFLLEECGDAFLAVPAPSQEQNGASQTAGKMRLSEEEKQEAMVAKATGKRFSGKAGKWQAKAYLKRCHLTERLGLKKLQIGDKVVHWEVVPIALSDVQVDASKPVSVESEGQEEQTDEHRD